MIRDLRVRESKIAERFTALVLLASMIHAAPTWAEEIPASRLWPCFRVLGSDNGAAGGPGGRGFHRPRVLLP